MNGPAHYLRAQPPNFVARAPLATTNAQGIHPPVCRYTFHLVFVPTVTSESCVGFRLDPSIGPQMQVAGRQTAFGSVGQA